MDGSVYFTGASKTLFSAVVKATMDGRTALPPSAFASAGTAAPDSERVSASVMEHRP
jgi:hypothetical protein